MFDSAVRPPWSNGQLKKLGKCIRDKSTASDLPDYSEVMLWYNDLAEAVAQRIRNELDWSSLIPGRSAPSPTARAKTIDTLRDKLLRESTIQLPNVQDVAGVRVEAEMTLTEQDSVALALANAFDHDATAIKDRRDGEHSGYRAVHVWLRLPAGRVEVQIRTHMQSQWANTYELAADLFGREIRYGQEPTGDAAVAVVDALHLTSRHIARIEAQVVKLPTVESSLERFEGAIKSNQHLLDKKSVDEAEGELRQMQENLEADQAELKRLQGSYSGMLSSLEDSLRQTIEARRN